MPVQTIIRPEFAEAVREALGNLSPNQAAYRTGISDEYIRKLAAGKVPSEAILARLATGLGADLAHLRQAAGYDPSPEMAQAAEVMADPALRDVVIRMRGAKLPETRRRIIEEVKRILEEEATETPPQTNGGTSPA